MNLIMNFSLFFKVLSFLSLCSASLADDILGCNGFIKSDISINYSDVEVKLFTKQGSLKDQTECAPNNGYYFLPLYDKGEYVLKVVPPEGWTFEPSEVLISVDGTTDPCSQGKDINFEFKGFAVQGKVVSAGQSVGPRGVTVELLRSADSGQKSQPIVVSQTLTGSGGEFLFTPVLPGSYKVRISHPVWKVGRSESPVEVSQTNGLVAPGSLTVTGYDVSGSVTSEGQPITGVSFVLFSNSKVKVEGCETSPLPDFSLDKSGSRGGQDQLIQLCHVVSDGGGKFTFPSLPPGEYSLMPHYAGSKSTKFDVQPRRLAFTLGHGSLRLSTPFQVKGFTVSGRVLWSPSGAPLSGAQILLNGKEAGVTGSDGSYTLESMRAGSYRLQVRAENVEFDESPVKVSSTSLPDLYPSRYRVSGRLLGKSSSQGGGGGGGGPYRLRVEPLTGDGGAAASGGSSESPLFTDQSGKFSLFLKPGKYRLTPETRSDSTQSDEGLLFSPSSREIEVISSPLTTGVEFSQLRARVSGRLLCMSPGLCPRHTVALKSRGKEGPPLQAVAVNGAYEFKDVAPGEYDIYIESGETGGVIWCWERETMPLSVLTEESTVPPFVQSGFTLSIIASHQTKVYYWPEGREKERQEIDVTPGSTHLCVSQASNYLLEPVSCHGYSSRRFLWTLPLPSAESVQSPPSAAGTAVHLTALTHENGFLLESDHPLPELQVKVTARSGNPGSESETVLPSKIQQAVVGRSGSSVWEYWVLTQLAPGQQVSCSPSAGPATLFYPPTVQLTGASDCLNISHQPLFKAQRGQIISGKVTTRDKVGLKDVLISLLDETEAAIQTQLTAADGSYKFPPIQASTQFKLSAVKEGYVLTELATKGEFSAHKLAEIVVTVKDKTDGAPLQGVLLSLSGGSDYRRNAATEGDGTMSFRSLSPGDYFLRPMMKEYKFSPSSKMVHVDEGATVQFTLSGERVAYSGHGQVTSLSGEGEGGVVVEAVGLGPCAIYLEEATSLATTGHFRLRGLQPRCEYNVRVKDGIDVNQHIAKSTPENITIKISNSDVEGLRLYAFRGEHRTDVMVHVVPEQGAEHLRSLRVKLASEESPESPLSSIRLSDLVKSTATGYSLSNVVLALPPLPADGRGYIVKLESTLSQATHQYTNRPVHFKTNSPLKVIRLPFDPQPRRKEPDLTQSSYFLLSGILLIATLLYNKERAGGLLSALLEARLPAPRSYHSSEDSNNSDSFQDLGSNLSTGAGGIGGPGGKKTKTKSRKL